jgi:hypothetical protein
VPLPEDAFTARCGGGDISSFLGRRPSPPLLPGRGAGASCSSAYAATAYASLHSSYPLVAWSSSTPGEEDPGGSGVFLFFLFEKLRFSDYHFISMYGMVSCLRSCGSLVIIFCRLLPAILIIIFCRFA